MEPGKADINGLLQQQQWEAAFHQIVDQYSDRLFHCALSILSSPDAAADTLQEAFISIWKNLHQFSGDSSVFTWCYSIVRNRALSDLRREQKHLGEQMDTQYDLAATSDLKWSAEEIEQQLERALADLPEKQKMVFELRYYQDLPFAEIATLTGTSVGALKASYHHARQKISTELATQLNLP